MNLPLDTLPFRGPAFPESPLDITPEQIVKLVSETNNPTTRIPTWRKKVTLADQDNKCFWCSALLDDQDPEARRNIFIACLVPQTLGGLTEAENIIAVCGKCKSAQASDPLDLCRQDPEKMERRALAFLHSHNHLLPEPCKNHKEVPDLLANRFLFKRTLMYAALVKDRAWICWPSSEKIPEDLLALFIIHPDNFKLTQVGQWKCLTIMPCQKYKSVPITFLHYIWQFIERNALVKKLSIPGHQDETPTEVFHYEYPMEMNDWSTTYTRHQDIFKRRPNMKSRWYKGGRKDA